jgi:diguanylate cyclase (GGDEF)-like protein
LTALDSTAQSHLHALQSEVLEAVASGRPLDHVADLLCRRVEQIVPAVVCSVLTLDENKCLHPLAGPSLPEAYSRAIDGLPIGPQAGSCGTAMYLGEPVEVHDISVDPRWIHAKEFPLAIGLRASWSSPIKARDERVVGSFAFYYRDCRPPNDLERAIVATCVHLCTVAIEHAEMQARLELTHRRFNAALENMSLGLCLYNANDILVMCNERFADMFGIPAGQVRTGLSFFAVAELVVQSTRLEWKTPEQACANRRALLERGARSTVLEQLPNGRQVLISVAPLVEGGWVATYEDVTERRRAEAQLLHMARHDVLTGLPNRLMFHERLEQVLAWCGRGEQCVVLSVDIDHFKQVNETLGHAVGDAVLRIAAQRLRGLGRDIDLIARVRGDEFCILLVDVQRAEHVNELAHLVVAALSEPYDIDGNRVILGTCVGIAIAPADGETPEKLQQNADIALYRAKTDGRGTCRFFEPDMDARLQAQRELELDLRQTLAEEGFELYYQPLVDLATNRVCGFEALLRWPHPVRGLVSAAAFIPLAEETGLIVPLGVWVLRQACAQAARWPDHVRVAVNLSAAQFRGETLVHTVVEALAASGLAATRLELEITESILLADNTATLATLHRLRDLGVRISMDDFGTGYSSLSYLRSFPFDRIKIDQSFVRELPEREDSIAIVRAVIGLGRSLNMATTAEGVETPAQLAHLRAEGCPEAQGYLFSRPRPARDIPLMLAPDFIARAVPALFVAAETASP